MESLHLLRDLLFWIFLLYAIFIVIASHGGNQKAELNIFVCVVLVICSLIVWSWFVIN